MPDELISNISDADLQNVLSDYDFEGYAVIEKVRQPDGRWTVVARKNAANGAPQSANTDDAVQDVEEPEEPEEPQQLQPAGQAQPQPAGQRPATQPQQPAGQQ